MISRILIVDSETTGTEDSSDLIEIGMVLYSVENRCSLQELSMLIPSTSENAAEKINRIPGAALDEMSAQKELCEAGTVLGQAMAEAADAYAAHYAEFDQKFLGFLPDKPWICTMSDCEWPKASRQGMSLVSLALEYGIGVSSAHRALTDCRLIAALFDRSDDLPQILSRAMRPKARFQALVSYDDRKLAHERGFRWDAAQKIWWRSMAIEDAELLPFRVTRIGETRAA